MSRAAATAVPGGRAMRARSRGRGVSIYRNAIYWFALLLMILILGFWRSYFSQLGRGGLHITHHVHGIAMLLWVVLLITQSWLIRPDGQVFVATPAGVYRADFTGAPERGDGSLPTKTIR